MPPDTLMNAVSSKKERCIKYATPLSVLLRRLVVDMQSPSPKFDCFPNGIRTEAKCFMPRFRPPWGKRLVFIDSASVDIQCGNV
ncbi:hypothetical protein TNCV_3733701 [Trichonephila clavipes]|uniref:Uncharacterized protein n=1 Tax=Trichonephila inaurata madagascariensis TaxID=2747483 RepID=A0A8X6XC40_9ARAC|nr:hypothetical protein TNCV_3733701 [Trichonephila clavipes]GFY50166.1 hypothetical protein TNIN_146491 [Trichonephila inaurata madagascariensis]